MLSMLAATFSLFVAEQHLTIQNVAATRFALGEDAVCSLTVGYDGVGFGQYICTSVAH